MKLKQKPAQGFLGEFFFPCKMLITALALPLLMPGDGAAMLRTRSRMPAYSDDAIESQRDASLGYHLNASNQPTPLWFTYYKT